MAGSRKHRNRKSVIALTCGVAIGAAASGLFTMSYLFLRDGDKDRALWLFGSAMLVALASGTLIAWGLITTDRPMYVGGDVSPVSAVKYSPSLAVLDSRSQAVSEAQSDGQEVFHGRATDTSGSDQETHGRV